MRRLVRGRAVIAFMNDANAPGPWSEVTLEDGSGRGTLDDWLAAGCWPDASREAPRLVWLPPGGDSESSRLWYADSEIAVPLEGLRSRPHMHNLPSAGTDETTLADVWPFSRSGLRMMLDVAPVLAPRRRASFAASLLRWSYASPEEAPPSPEEEECLAACEAWGAGGGEAPVQTAGNNAHRIGVAGSPGALLCQISLHADSRDAGFYPWLAVYRRLKSLARDDEDRFLRLDAASADAARAALPWHDLLAEAVGRAVGAP